MRFQWETSRQLRELGRKKSGLNDPNSRNWRNCLENPAVANDVND